MINYSSEGRNLYLVRGVPGSGKSTFAKQLGGTHFETDTYFMVDGEYKFDPSNSKAPFSGVVKFTPDLNFKGAVPAVAVPAPISIFADAGLPPVGL